MTIKQINNISLSILGFLCLLIVAGCSKELNRGPKSATYGEKFWAGQGAAHQAANAMYVQLRSSLLAAPEHNNGEAGHFLFGDYVTGLYRHAAGDVFIPYGLTSTGTKPWNFSYLPYGSGVVNDWSRFYRLIAQANLILKNVPNIPSANFSSEAERKKYLGEALFIRAYTYFYITRIWGDPVYVSNTFDDADYENIPPIARSDENAVLDSCLRDLRVAAGYLSNTKLAIRANQGAAHALMAHIFQWQKKYDSTHKYCQEIISNGGYNLEPMETYGNIWRGKSKENIFEVYCQFNNVTNETTSNALAAFIKGSYTDNIRYSCWLAPKAGLMISGVFSDTANDLRFKNYMAYTPAIGGDEEGYMALKYSDIQYADAGNKTGAFLNNNVVLFRLADIILLDAEALAYKGQLQESINLLKLTQQRAQINTYQNINTIDNLIYEVFLERGRELFAEGCWFYDIIRNEQRTGWLQSIGYLPARVAPNAKGYYWPLDMATLFPTNALLTQNPYWAANGGR